MQNEKAQWAKQHHFGLILLLGALTTISPFSIDMYLPAFHQIADALGSTQERVALSLSSYFIGLAVGQLIYGPFLDRFGRKPPLIFGLSIYILACFACLLSWNVEALIAFRLLQALGGCVAGVAAVAMVRDFFPLSEGARVFSKLMLVLSVSPLFAPTVGSFVVTAWGWQSVFLFLAGIVALILACVIFLLPEGHRADPSISLSPPAIARNFGQILSHPRFRRFAGSAAFSFSGLFIYVAGSPAIFMGKFGLDARQFGLVFALLSVGIIGGGQFNNYFLKHYSGEKIYRTAIVSQLIVALIFALGAAFDLYGLVAHIVLIFLFLACAGLTYPNAASNALAPFEKNSGSASSVLGCLQMSVGAIGAAGFGFLNLPANVGVSSLMAAGTFIGCLIFFFGGKRAET
ncbi:MAG: Bcr/CflA family efflux MFS transporter [Proteobacteria bacterium]|nr:MAG: Bcr/CflA family efflux MFS transporter [Pseudomonadota bacterium]